ncbi:MAG: 50S ribosomal protein L35 [Deltaproteobacteria bacterium]|nr:50S ribosomal protein L35 [Deltaproteobacteria bacterium]
MPKMKSCRGAAKRFTVLKSGVIKRKKAYHSHILTSKTTKQKRGLRQGAYISPEDAAQIRRLLPYG